VIRLRWRLGLAAVSIVLAASGLLSLARTLGHLAGKMQRYVSDVKADINCEIELDDLKKMRDSMQQAASSFQSDITSEVNKTEAELQKAADELNKTTEEINKSLNAAHTETPAPPPHEAFQAEPAVEPAAPEVPAKTKVS